MKRKMIGVILFMSFFWIQPAHADEWSGKDTAWEATCLVLMMADWAQTSNMVHRGFLLDGKEVNEINPILGRRPDSQKVDLYFASAILTHVGMSYLLPNPYRRYFQMGTVGLELFIIGNNYGIGMKMSW